MIHYLLYRQLGLVGTWAPFSVRGGEARGERGEGRRGEVRGAVFPATAQRGVVPWHGSCFRFLRFEQQPGRGGIAILPGRIGATCAYSSHRVCQPPLYKYETIVRISVFGGPFLLLQIARTVWIFQEKSGTRTSVRGQFCKSAPSRCALRSKLYCGNTCLRLAIDLQAHTSCFLLGPSPAPQPLCFEPWSVRRPRLTLQVKPGSRYRCGKSD